MNITIERAVTLREQAANIIRKMIVAGDLKAGNPVSVRQISQRLGVSASPVKEALRILEVEGLVYSLARKGFYHNAAMLLCNDYQFIHIVHSLTSR